MDGKVRFPIEIILILLIYFCVISELNIVVLISFHSYCHNAWGNYLKYSIAYFGSWFQRFPYVTPKRVSYSWVTAIVVTSKIGSHYTSRFLLLYLLFICVPIYICLHCHWVRVFPLYLGIPYRETVLVSIILWWRDTKRYLTTLIKWFI